jgi:hypothetical protein
LQRDDSNLNRVNVAISFFFAFFPGVKFGFPEQLEESSFGSRWSLRMTILAGWSVSISLLFARLRFEEGCGALCRGGGPEACREARVSRDSDPRRIVSASDSELRVVM